MALSSATTGNGPLLAITAFPCVGGGVNPLLFGGEDAVLQVV
jgi:hypothetical protein